MPWQKGERKKDPSLYAPLFFSLSLSLSHMRLGEKESTEKVTKLFPPPLLLSSDFTFTLSLSL
jgi:hypothetical protein